MKREKFPCRSRFMSGLTIPDFPGIWFAVHYWIRAQSVGFFRISSVDQLERSFAGRRRRQGAVGRAFGWVSPAMNREAGLSEVGGY